MNPLPSNLTEHPEHADDCDGRCRWVVFPNANPAHLARTCVAKKPPLPARKPHRVSPDKLRAFFDTKIIEGASATTADGTQRKRLIKQGGDFKVCRRYYADPLGLWSDVYVGTLAGAVAFYNGMG